MKNKDIQKIYDWTESELKILKENYCNSDNKTLIELIPNHSLVAIKLKANRIGLLKNNYFWTPTEEKFLKKNYLKYGTKYCSDYLNKSYKSIGKKVFTMKLGGMRKIYNNIKHHSYYKVNSNMFLKITKPEIAYILGIIYADGHLKKESNEISLTCIKKDIDEIKWMFDITGDWSYNTFKKKEGWQEMAILRTSNPYITEFLIKNDYGKKSGTSADKILKQIPKKLQNYFFLGYSDGDGCFYKGLKQYQYTISSCYKQDWTFIENLYNSISLKFKVYRNERINENNKLSRNSSIRISNRNDVIILGDFLYKNYKNDFIGFTRKYNNYLKIKSSRE